MRVTVQFTAQLRAAIGPSELQLDVADDSTVWSVIQKLAERYPQAFAQFVLDSKGRLLPSMLICVHNQQITAPQQQALKSGDTVTFLSAISGG
jgi:molybdopterin converting factor small subunit